MEEPEHDDYVGPDEDQDPVHWEKHVRSETLNHGARIRPVPKRTLLKDREIKRDKSVFAKNLLELIRQAGLTKVEAPAQLGVNSRWLRRATDSGLARIDKRTRADLERVARHFGLAGPEQLWEPALSPKRRSPELEEQVLSLREKVNWLYAKKLLELLETGEHDFLMKLIDSLHASELRKVGGEAGAKNMAAVNVEKNASGLKGRLGRKGSIG